MRPDRLTRLVRRERVVPATDYFRAHPKSTPALRVGETIFVSGQVARDANGVLVGEGEPVTQFHQTMRNLDRVLREAECGFENIVKMTMWLVDMTACQEVLEARRDYFRKFTPPSATIGVTGLADAGFLIEIDAIAVLGVVE
jgi:2-iminobutanoate/2-iminopropanoate deaminase